ncbi:MAG: DUF4476 domain-containing protein [Chitinophagaceae bacterium]|nr:DUF4476 domain-containing protein [Chitinophagaceae bacterium]
MSKNDHGYLLKNFGDKGWGLFDLQTLAVQMSSGVSAKIEQSNEIKDVSPFTNILAKAAGDPSLKETMISSVVQEKGTGTSVNENEKKAIDITNIVTEKPVDNKEAVVVKKEESKGEEIQPPKEPVQKVEPVIVKTEESKAESEEQPVNKQEESINTEINNYKPSIVIKRSETSMTDGFGLVFIDKDDKGASDTISLIIPNPKPIVIPKENSSKEEKKFLEILPDSVKAAEEKTVVKTEPQKFYREMNNCPSLARDNDFFKLRKLMAASEGDDNMIIEAKEYFKAKCFSTQQIKNLGSLFLSDLGKYNFFEASYNHVTDKKNFDSLQTELKDEHYINLFKAMIRN